MLKDELVECRTILRDAQRLVMGNGDIPSLLAALVDHTVGAHSRVVDDGKRVRGRCSPARRCPLMPRWHLTLLAGVLAALVLTSCAGTGSIFAELERVADVERGRPVLVFVYTDG